MRLTITEPCVIEADGPILISPIIDVTPERIEVIEPKRRTINYPKTRRPHPRMRKQCLYCHRSYNGVTQQMYCSSKCKHDWYSHGKKGMPQGLDIRAGATGLDVEVVNR